MKLHDPFIISARLMPALKIGDATLSLVSTAIANVRTRATFALDLPDGRTFSDESMQSGCGGFRSVVEAFETYLSFLSAAGEARQYEERTGRTSDNGDMFPLHIMQWASDNLSDIECAHCDLRDEEGNPRAELIEL